LSANRNLPRLGRSVTISRLVFTDGVMCRSNGSVVPS
jgi:hypothetical protein